MARSVEQGAASLLFQYLKASGQGRLTEVQKITGPGN